MTKVLKAYLRLCRSIYDFYRKRGDNIPALYAFVITSLLVGFNLMTIIDVYSLLSNKYDIIPSRYALLPFVIIALINYALVFRSKKYLGDEYSEAKTVNVLLYIIASAILIVTSGAFIRAHYLAAGS